MEGGGENRLKTGVARARGERAVNTGGEEIRGVNWVGEWETGGTLASDLASGGRAGRRRDDVQMALARVAHSSRPRPVVSTPHCFRKYVPGCSVIDAQARPEGVVPAEVVGALRGSARHVHHAHLEAWGLHVRVWRVKC